MQRSFFTVVIFIFYFYPASGQNIEKNIRSLENDFKNFKYQQVIEKGKFLLSDAYTTHEDSLVIYQYMLSSAYAVNDTTLAKQIIKSILKSDRKYSLDPKNTSPKIIELFEYMKKKYNQNALDKDLKVKPRERQQTYPPPLHPGLAVASIFLPGSGHYFDGLKTKGAVFSSVSSLWLAGSVYAIYHTADKREAYLSAGKDADFTKLYDTYNSAYKTRNLLLIGYALWNIYCLYDLNKEHAANFNISVKNGALSLNLLKTW